MRIIALVIMVCSFIFGVFSMANISKIAKDNRVINSGSQKRHKIIGIIKEYWKICIIFMAFLAGFILILLTIKINQEKENIISLVTIIYSIIFIVVALLGKKKAVKKIDKEIN